MKGASIYKVRLKIPDYDAQTSTILALANSGYSVWVEEESESSYVCFKLGKDSISQNLEYDK